MFAGLCGLQCDSSIFPRAEQSSEVAFCKNEIEIDIFLVDVNCGDCGNNFLVSRVHLQERFHAIDCDVSLSHHSSQYFIKLRCLLLRSCHLDISDDIIANVKAFVWARSII